VQWVKKPGLLQKVKEEFFMINIWIPNWKWSTKLFLNLEKCRHLVVTSFPISPKFQIFAINK
jgi:hypothetical protein